jgi:hypothetical protein
MWFLRASKDEVKDAASSVESDKLDEIQQPAASAEGDWISHWSTEDRAWQYVTEAKEDPTKPVTFFKYLEIAKDGGLSEITGTKGEDDHLWSSTRYISACTAVLFMFGNTAYVVYVDFQILFGRRSVFGVNDYLLSNIVVKYLNIVLNFISRMFSSEEHDFFDNPAKLIASVELLILLGLWIRVCWALCQMLSGHWRRWYAAQNLFFNLIPMIGVYSSLLMLFPAAPKVFIQDLFTYLFYRDSKSYYRDLAWLAISRVLCFIVGFDSFLVKFREGANQFIISTPASDKTQFQLAYFIGAFMLLNQILGVVQLSWMIRERLFRFVFAGEDGIMSSGELVKRDTWNAQVAQTLFTSYSNCIDKFTMLLTFSDDDFQRLTLHERKRDTNLNLKLSSIVQESV